MNLFKSHLNSYFHKSSNYQSAVNHQDGFAFVAIILVLVTIFSILMVSGAGNFMASHQPAPPPGQGDGSTQPPDDSDQTPPDGGNNDDQWTISYTIDRCEDEVAEGSITTGGVSQGYVALERRNPDGSYQAVTSETVVALDASLTLDITVEYNITPWRLNLYEGGSGTTDNHSGGISRATVDGSPTGC